MGHHRAAVPAALRGRERARRGGHVRAYHHDQVRRQRRGELAPVAARGVRPRLLGRRGVHVLARRGARTRRCRRRRGLRRDRRAGGPRRGAGARRPARGGVLGRDRSFDESGRGRLLGPPGPGGAPPAGRRARHRDRRAPTRLQPGLPVRLAPRTLLVRRPDGLPSPLLGDLRHPDVGPPREFAGLPTVRSRSGRLRRLLAVPRDPPPRPGPGRSPPKSSTWRPTATPPGTRSSGGSASLRPRPRS